MRDVAAIAGPDPVGSNADDFCDGLHLGPGGNRKVFQRLQARMREYLQGDGLRMKCLLPVSQHLLRCAPTRTNQAQRAVRFDECGIQPFLSVILLRQACFDWR